MTRKAGNELKHKGEKKTYKQKKHLSVLTPADFEVHFEEQNCARNVRNKARRSYKSIKMIP